MLSAPNCLMNIRWRLDDVYSDGPCPQLWRDCDNVTFSSGSVIMSWPRLRVWSPQTSLAPGGRGLVTGHGGGMLRALIGKKLGKQRKKVFVFLTTNYLKDSKSKASNKTNVHCILPFVIEMSLRRVNIPSCLTSEHYGSGPDRMSGAGRIFFANGDWDPVTSCPELERGSHHPGPQSLGDPKTNVSTLACCKNINRLKVPIVCRWGKFVIAINQGRIADSSLIWSDGLEFDTRLALSALRDSLSWDFTPTSIFW